MLFNLDRLSVPIGCEFVFTQLICHDRQLDVRMTAQFLGNMQGVLV